jgi:hypothetical protein
MKLCRLLYVIADICTAYAYFIVSTELSRLDVNKRAVHTKFILNLGRNCPSMTYDELDVATERFARKHFLGKGGFGEVYKGVLDGNHVSSCVSWQFNSCSSVRLCIKVRNNFISSMLVALSTL